MLEEGVVQRRENALLVLAEIIARYQVQGGPGLGVVLVVPIRVVPATAVVDLLRAQSEQEEVLGPRLFGHLDRRAIARADRQRSVHHELHVAGAAGLVTG